MSSEKNYEEAQWYVMRAYKSERTAEEHLSANYGLKYYIPKLQSLRTVNGKKVTCMVPIIHSMVFVHATHQQIVDFKRLYYNALQFVTRKIEGKAAYLIVPPVQMDSFIKVCEQKEREVHFFRPEEINIGKNAVNLAKGNRVRVHGGPFDKVEGYFMKIAKKRSRQLVVIIPDLLVATTEVEPDYIEIIE